jgi:predicted nucleotidyltransferase
MAANVEAVIGETRHYADEVRRHFPVEKVYLFGSYAKGTADEFSDVDVVFFLRDYGGKTRFDIGVQLLKLCRSYKVCFEPLVFKISEIERDNPFVNEILRTGIEI